MKKILTGILAFLLIAPILTHAQVVDTSTMTDNQLRVYLISLIEEVIKLEQQLIAMQNNEAAGPPVVVPPQQPIATTGQPASTTIAGATAPAGNFAVGYSIQLIMWPGAVIADPSRTFITDPNLVIDRPGAVEAREGSYAQLGAVLMNPNGQAINDAIVTVITPDSAQNTQINGTGNVYGNPAVAYYPYTYGFKNAGDHTITFSGMGATATITLKAN